METAVIGQGSILPLRRGLQVAEGVNFKLIETITVLDKLAIERVECRSGRVTMFKKDNRRLDSACQKLYDHLAVVPLHICQQQINFVIRCLSIRVCTESAGTDGRAFQHLLHRSNSVQHVLLRKRRVDEEHQACLAQLMRYPQSLSRPHILGKGFFKVNFAATTAEARDPFGSDRLH